MTTNSIASVEQSEDPVVNWLMESDPAIRWQVMSDLTSAPEDLVSAERSRVATESWGARLLNQQRPDGNWGDDVSQPVWASTLYTLMLLRNLGLDPASAEAQKAIGLVKESVTWGAEFGNSPFFEGEVEPCINGATLAIGSYFGEASNRLVDRLLGEQLEDGGWNCDAPKSQRSSFHTTICVLEGLLEFEKARGGNSTVADSRNRGQEYLLERHMFKRLSTGELIDNRWMHFSFPTNWHYDILRGLEYMRSTGGPPDERVDEAVELLVQARQQDGRWLLRYPNPDPPRWWSYTVDVEMDDGEGKPSRWNTLRALRVLDWHSGKRTFEPGHQRLD